MGRNLILGLQPTANMKVYRFQLIWASHPQEVRIDGYRCCEPGCKYQIKTCRTDLFQKHAAKHEFAAFVDHNR